MAQLFNQSYSLMFELMLHYKKENYRITENCRLDLSTVTCFKNKGKKMRKTSKNFGYL
jgi:hypothetical protein